MATTTNRPSQTKEMSLTSDMIVAEKYFHDTLILVTKYKMLLCLVAVNLMYLNLYTYLVSLIEVGCHLGF